ncbi:sulfotransferase family protein [Sagittula salina]|uniref:Sulfotransferase n=1 Tax=Sagittula salina TaxID=2820268 RepID=A0A940MWF6_9RHOB|nr:sulfotransferase [Sagittula salina]MBP0484124.1 sulfotransferase [Sagittula salina]
MLSHRYVFVGGLHRSGTSLTARLIAALPGVAAIEGAPVPENEGVYLQGAIPHTARHGAPMQFATDPSQHLVEGCGYDRLETRTRLEEDWAPWFGEGAWRVEKSPVNLTRMRLYQQIFPLSQFVVVTRHPEKVASAVAKWVDCPAPALVDHWLDAHDTVAEDMTYLHAVLVLRYEDLIADPQASLDRLAAFLGVETAQIPMRIANGNTDYPDAPRMSAIQAVRAARWGYGPGETLPRPPEVRHPLRAVREACQAVA